MLRHESWLLYNSNNSKSNITEGVSIFTMISPFQGTARNYDYGHKRLLFIATAEEKEILININAFELDCESSLLKRWNTLCRSLVSSYEVYFSVSSKEVIFDICTRQLWINWYRVSKIFTEKVFKRVSSLKSGYLMLEMKQVKVWELP